MSDKVTKGLMLRSAEGFLMQFVQLVIQLVMARLLLPSDYGIVAILTTFTNIANTLVNSGLGSALLQRKKITQKDICTVFYIELGIAVLMYGVIFLAAPVIATFYENPLLTTYLRVFALIVVFSGLSSIQLTVTRHRLDFMPSLVSGIGSTLTHAVVGVWMALSGYGVWSLILSQLAGGIVRCVILTFMVRWLPSLVFSFQSFKSLFSYSWKLFVGWMIGTLYQDVFSWIIGKKFDSATLGYYTKGNSIPAMVNRTVTQVTTAVMFPAVSKHQDDQTKVKAQTRMMISVIAAMVFPVMAGLAGAAESLVMIILTEKWILSVPVIQLMCIPLSLNVLGNANVQSFNAIGQSGLFLRLEIIKRSITIILVAICMNISFYAMLASIGVGGVIALIFNGYYNNKLFSYKTREYLADIVPYALCSVVLFLIVNWLNALIPHLVIRLIVQLMVCVAVYFGLIFSGAFPAYAAVRKLLLGKLKRKKV